MNPVVKFLVSRPGRIIRVAAGILLLIIGFAVVEDVVVGAILMVIGLVALLAGLLDYCVIGPLFGAPMSGAKIRAGK